MRGRARRGTSRCPGPSWPLSAVARDSTASCDPGVPRPQTRPHCSSASRLLRWAGLAEVHSGCGSVAPSAEGGLCSPAKGMITCLPESPWHSHLQGCQDAHAGPPALHLLAQRPYFIVVEQLGHTGRGHDQPAWFGERLRAGQSRYRLWGSVPPPVKWARFPQGALPVTFFSLLQISMRPPS